MAPEGRKVGLLKRVRTGVKLKWRLREENTVADDIASPVYTTGHTETIHGRV